MSRCQKAVPRQQSDRSVRTVYDHGRRPSCDDLTEDADHVDNDDTWVRPPRGRIPAAGSVTHDVVTSCYDAWVVESPTARGVPHSGRGSSEVAQCRRVSEPREAHQCRPSDPGPGSPWGRSLDASRSTESSAIARRLTWNGRSRDARPTAQAHVHTALRIAALALRSWTATTAGDPKVLPMPASGHCLGKTRNASPKSADSSLRRAKTSSRSLPGCAPPAGAGVSSPGASSSSSRCSARVPSRNGYDRFLTPPSRSEKSVSRARHRPSHGQAAERQRRRSWALGRWASYVRPGPSRSPVWPSSSRPTWS